MVKIENLEEFNNIKNSNFGYIVIKENDTVIHRTSCSEINSDKFLDSNNFQISFHWFSTMALAEKAFADIKECVICNPD